MVFYSYGADILYKNSSFVYAFFIMAYPTLYWSQW